VWFTVTNCPHSMRLYAKERTKTGTLRERGKREVRLSMRARKSNANRRSITRQTGIANYNKKNAMFNRVERDNIDLPERKNAWHGIGANRNVLFAYVTVCVITELGSAAVCRGGVGDGRSDMVEWP